MKLKGRIDRLERAAVAARAEASPEPEDPMQLLVSDPVAYRMFCRLADHMDGRVHFQWPLGALEPLSEAEVIELTRAFEERVEMLWGARRTTAPVP